jgi:pimeloyl-ACP methyl ester carboxylesterase
MYASVNGLEMYHETHGEGAPLVLLHGALSTIGVDFGGMIPGLARSRRVIGVEQQAHGHTADIDRPLGYEQMADDTIALLRELGIERADLFGYSMGGGVALQIALKQPGLVRKLVAGGGTVYNREGFHPGLLDGVEGVTPEMLHGTPFHAAYLEAAPRPEDFGAMVAKVGELNKSFVGWTADQVRSLEPPMMVMIGDSDISRPEHDVELFRLLGGGVIGDMQGIPRSRLAILPGTGHVSFPTRADWIIPMVEDFLSAE